MLWSSLTIGQLFPVFGIAGMVGRKTRSDWHSTNFLKGFRGTILVVIGILSMGSLIFVYQASLVLNLKHHRIPPKILLMEYKEDSTTACQLPTLNPFHPSVTQFMKDLGKLRCTGETYSSFHNNVLQVKGKGIVSAQYRKIERMPGNDFDVVLSNPVSVQNTQKGESFSGDFG